MANEPKFDNGNTSGAGTDKPRVGNGKVNNSRADRSRVDDGKENSLKVAKVFVGRDLVKEVNIRAQDF